MGNKEATKRIISSGPSRFKKKKFTSNRFTGGRKRTVEVEGQHLVDNVLQQDLSSCSSAANNSARYRKLHSRCGVNKDEISPNTSANHFITFFWIAGYYRISCQLLVMGLWCSG